MAAARFVRMMTVGLALLALSGCATKIQSDVARFHALSAPTGETFRIVPSDEAKKGSLEFEQYAALVRGELSKLGYKPVNAENEAQLEVRVDYAVDNGREKVATRPGTSFYRYSWANRAFYPYRGHHYWSWYDPFWDPWGWNDQEVYSYTIYDRSLTLAIVRPGDGNKSVFEGKVESLGRSNNLPELMPYLVQAMFTDFPGQSGVTKRVVIEPRTK
jgi:Domain of unknown function (DUF4136)